MADPDYLVRLVRLVRSNAPGPGRPLGRLRLSLDGIIQAIAEQHSVDPATITEVRLAGLPGPDGVLHLTKDRRAFLTAKQMRAIGGFDRAGTRTRVKFLLPLKRWVYDVLFIDAQPKEGQESNTSIGNYNAETGEVDTNGSGLGITFRVTETARGSPLKRLERMNDRLRHHFRGWLKGFPLGWEPSEGEVATAVMEPKGPKGRRWMVQAVRESHREQKTIKSAGGSIPFHGPHKTIFKVAFNDLTNIKTTLPGGDTFEERI